MMTALMVCLAFIVGFVFGGLAVLKADAAECGRGFIKAEGKIYRVEELGQ